MPRQRIDVPHEIDFISILDAEGNVDEELAPEVSTEVLERLHRSMLQSRRFDERMLKLQKQGRLGTFAPATGQEAAQLGAVMHLREDDWMVPSYREIPALLWRGTPMAGLLVFNAGYNEGGAIEAERNDLPIAVSVGTQMLHAAGIGYALRRHGSDGVAMTFFGDGATSEGDFHEALNFASVFDSPTVFVCENNGYAISVPRSKQTSSRTLAQKAIAYGMPAIQVDGNDILAVLSACQEAVRRAREESRPTLVECLTYRLEVHTTVDDPSKYRSEEEVERWQQRDPLSRFQAYLRNRGQLDEQTLEELESQIADDLDRAVAAMDEQIEAAAGPEMLFEHVLRDEHPYLRRQRSWMES